MVFRGFRLAASSFASASFIVAQQFFIQVPLVQAQTTNSNPENTKRFETPRLNGNRLDLCYRWGTNCGRPAAIAYCQLLGYADVLDFAVDSSPKTTECIGDGAVCLEGVNNPICDSFLYITCLGTGIDEPLPGGVAE